MLAVGSRKGFMYCIYIQITPGRVPKMSYAELHCISNFSFLRGASHPEELVAEAARQGYRALAITDECSLAGVVKAHVAAREHGLHLITKPARPNQLSSAR